MTLWEEDDAKPEGREQINEAWRRIFGCEKPSREARVGYYDGGDSFSFLYADGRIEGESYCGESISITLEEARAYVSRLGNEIQRLTWHKERVEAEIAKRMPPPAPMTPEVKATLDAIPIHLIERYAADRARRRAQEPPNPASLEVRS